MQKISIPPGERIFEKEYSFYSSMDNSHAKLIISKEETADRTYKVAVQYLGLHEARNRSYSKWQVSINDKDLMCKSITSEIYRGPDTLYTMGSTRLQFKQVGSHEIMIKETDCENSNSEIRVDISCTPYRYKIVETNDYKIICLVAAAAFLYYQLL